jgi:hypothetical protein
VTITLPGYSYTIFTIEDGFAFGKPWVPSGKKFIMEKAIATGARNSLIRLIIMVERKSDLGSYTEIGEAYGYQNCKVEIGRAYTWSEDSRPVYAIFNYDSSWVTFRINIYGFVEKVV